MKQDDWSDWMRAGIAGDETAYRRLLTQMAPVLRGVVRARASMMDEAWCEDVVQEVLLTIHLKRGSWDDQQPLRPWAYAITRHKLIDALRKQGRRVHVPVDDFANDLTAPISEDPFELSDAERIIDRLGDRDAALLRCLVVEGREKQDCGARLGMNEGALRVALHRSLKRLAAIRKELAE